MNWNIQDRDTVSQAMYTRINKDFSLLLRYFFIIFLLYFPDILIHEIIQLEN